MEKASKSLGKTRKSLTKGIETDINDKVHNFRSRGAGFLLT